MKLNTPHDFLCHECFKNIYIIGVRNIEGENHSEHTVNCFLDSNYENIALSKDFRILRNLEIKTSFFCSNQMKIQEIDHSVTTKKIF